MTAVTEFPWVQLFPWCIALKISPAMLIHSYRRGRSRANLVCCCPIFPSVHFPRLCAFNPASASSCCVYSTCSSPCLFLISALCVHHLFAPRVLVLSCLFHFRLQNVSLLISLPPPSIGFSIMCIIRFPSSLGSPSPHLASSSFTRGDVPG